MTKRDRRPLPNPLANEPRVAIFWVVSGKPVIDSIPLSGAEAYGDFRIHPGDHYSVWSKLQQAGAVPAEMEYEEAPRGRVMYSTKTGRFTLLADRCILCHRQFLAQIRSELHLPRSMKLDTDSHYRCFACLYGDVTGD